MTSRRSPGTAAINRPRELAIWTYLICFVQRLKLSGPWADPAPPLSTRHCALTTVGGPNCRWPTRAADGRRPTGPSPGSLAGRFTWVPEPKLGVATVGMVSNCWGPQLLGTGLRWLHGAGPAGPHPGFTSPGRWNVARSISVERRCTRAED